MRWWGLILEENQLIALDTWASYTLKLLQSLGRTGWSSVGRNSLKICVTSALHMGHFSHLNKWVFRSRELFFKLISLTWLHTAYRIKRGHMKRIRHLYCCPYRFCRSPLPRFVYSPPLGSVGCVLPDSPFPPKLPLIQGQHMEFRCGVKLFLRDRSPLCKSSGCQTHIFSLARCPRWRSTKMFPETSEIVMNVLHTIFVNTTLKSLMNCVVTSVLTVSQE